MTARALELIAAADAIFYDRLIPPGALDGAREDAELIYVGKAPGKPSVPQEEIGERLIEAARAGKSVVRLKGGDPFVFGRGGEEGEALREAGVEFEVVPGVTAGVAATAYAGIPVTHRDDASAVAFVTGHEDPEKEESALDWEALARFPGTLVFYMGVKRLADNAAALIEAGRDADEPAAAIERGTMDGQRTVVATLGTLAEAVEREGVGAPALIVVGKVVERARGAGLARAPPPARQDASSSPAPAPRPAASPRRCATRRRGGRAAGDPDRAAARERRGARCGRRDRRLRADLRDQPQRVAPAVRGAARGRARCARARAGKAAGRQRSAAHRHDVAAIGRHGAAPRAWIAADIVPERFVAESLVEALGEVDVTGKRVLVARAAEARDVIPEHLSERGAEVDIVALYETVREEPSRRGGRGRPERRLRHLHLLLDRPQPDRGARRPLPQRRPHSLDRPRNQRGRPRRRPRGPRRSPPPRHRRPLAALLADATPG